MKVWNGRFFDSPLLLVLPTSLFFNNLILFSTVRVPPKKATLATTIKYIEAREEDTSKPMTTKVCVFHRLSPST